MIEKEEPEEYEVFSISKKSKFYAYSEGFFLKTPIFIFFTSNPKESF